MWIFTEKKNYNLSHSLVLEGLEVPIKSSRVAGYLRSRLEQSDFESGPVERPSRTAARYAPSDDSNGLLEVNQGV